MKKKKPYKIVKTELFKEQEKALPKKVKKELDKALKELAKNPTKTLGSMGIDGEPNVHELRRWMGRVRPPVIDLVLEYLHTKDCLNKKGKGLAHNFWLKYIRK